MVTIYYIIVVTSVVIFASVLTFGAYVMQSKLAQLDEPTERSNHIRPTPTGVGIGFMAAILSFMVVVNAPGNVILAAILLMVVSYFDDRASLSVRSRMGVQAIAVIMAITAIEQPVLQGLLPLWLDRTLVFFVWMWMINLTNFMDGIDEITVTQVGCVCLGIVVLGYISPLVPQSLMIDAVVIMAGALSFYPWNRHPAMCFMGDAGSVPLGFLKGYLLLSLASHGHWAAALILPAYYLTDSTYTLIARLRHHEPFWKAHSKHFYQKAVRAGRSHAQVARQLLLYNMLTILLALSSIHSTLVGALAVAAAYAFALALCFHFLKTPQQAAPCHR